MRINSADFDSEVVGTTVGDVLEVVVRRGATSRMLEVTSWSLDWDATRQVQGQATLTLADPDGTLAPWGMGDLLAPGGSRLSLAWISGLSKTRVPLGVWRIRSADPTESWRTYELGTSVARVPGGGSVTIRADEDTATAVLARLDADQPSTTTCLAEVARLMRPVSAVTVAAGVSDRAIPRGLVYADSRIDEIEDHLDRVGAVHRMAPDGSMEIVSATSGTPVWTIAGGEDGASISITRALSDEGLYNVAVSQGESADGKPLVGRAQLEAGPLSVFGPFGRVPIFHTSPATEQHSVTLDAGTVLATRQKGGEVDLDVVCLTHPGLQPHDVVTLVAATAAGDQPLTGRVMGMQMSSAAGVPAKSMSLRVRVSVEGLEMIAARVRRG